MSLSAGQGLGPYEVVGPLGAGGMGEVFTARDTRLDRLVAVKVLPRELAADPDRRARFERETIGNCFEKLEKAREFQSRIDGIDRDVHKFNVDVLALVEKTAPDLQKLSPDQAALQMHTLLGKARQAHELLKKINEEIETLTADIENAQKTLASLDGRMAEFLATARCDKVSDLAGAISKFAEYQRLHEKISDAESSLAKMSDGLSLEEIKLQAAAVDVDELPGLIAALQRQIDEELYPRIKAASKLIGEES